MKNNINFRGKMTFFALHGLVADMLLSKSYKTKQKKHLMGDSDVTKSLKLGNLSRLSCLNIVTGLGTLFRLYKRN